MKILNAITIHEKANHLIAETYNPFQTYPFETLPKTVDTDIVFYDKFKNMHGYQYRIVLFEVPGNLIIFGNAMYGVNAFMMKEIAAAQNANIAGGYLLNRNDPNMIQLKEQVLNQKRVDLSLNPVMKNAELYSHRKSIITYEVDAFCALIPIPQRHSFLQYLLTPFDRLSWTFLVITIVSCGVVWRLYNRYRPRNSDSSLYFIYTVVVSFVGQSIPLRANTRMQLVLLQLCIWMTFIMGNAYQSIIISTMSSSRNGTRLNTVDDMINSNLKFMVDPRFYNRANLEFAKIKDRMTIGSGTVNYTETARDNYAIIASCSMLNYEMHEQGSVNAINNYYMLPEQMMPFYEALELAAESPFYETLQRYMNYIHESGIRQHFDFVRDQRIWTMRRKLDEDYIAKEEYLLTWDDIHGVFYLLTVGCVISVLVFLLEIFWHDCLRHLKLRSFNNESQIRPQQSRRRMRVRRIQVQPAAEAFEMSEM